MVYLERRVAYNQESERIGYNDYVHNDRWRQTPDQEFVSLC